MTNNEIDTSRIEDIVSKYLIGLSAYEKKTLPPIVSKSSARLFTFQTDAYLIVSIIEQREENRLSKLQEKRISPFPELIKPSFISAQAAFALEKSKNVLIENCSVRNMFSLSLGKDCTVILHNHKQSVKDKKIGVSEYTIELAFIVSYGNEIDVHSVYEYVKNLVEYYVNKSRSANKKVSS